MTNFRCAKCGETYLDCICYAEYAVGSMPAPMAPAFGPSMLTPEDRDVMKRYVGSVYRAPDLIIDSKEKGPYLFRWHVVPRCANGCNVYFHIQVASDPERPLHDHPWDNQSVILSGGYDEIVQAEPPNGDVVVRRLRKGDIAMRRATLAHRLELPAGISYTMTQFTTGRTLRDWGFWIDGKWHKYDTCCSIDPITKQSFFKYPESAAP